MLPCMMLRRMCEGILDTLISFLFGDWRVGLGGGASSASLDSAERGGGGGGEEESFGSARRKVS
jgi:hypothetical protein